MYLPDVTVKNPVPPLVRFLPVDAAIAEIVYWVGLSHEIDRPNFGTGVLTCANGHV